MNLLDSSISIGDGAIYSVFGLVFVMLGISLLVLIFMLFGFGMKKWNERKKKEPPAPAPAPAPAEAAEGIPPEVVAAITAAVAVYLEGEQVKCDFVVRRIRKI